jgi:hypothetical protein
MTFGQMSWFRVGELNLDQNNRYWIVKVGRLAILWERGP